SGYLVVGGGRTLLVDAGSGTLAELQRHVRLEDVDAVVLSHEHPDHWSDLEGLWVARWHLGLPPLPVYAPPGLRGRVYHSSGPELSWVEVEAGDRVELGGLSVSFSATDHGPPTLAMRLDCGGASIGYSADTGPGWSLEALGPGLDLALCEATYTSKEEGSLPHLSARQAGASARSAGAGELVLTHRWPTVGADEVFEEGSEAFGRPVLQAAVGEVYQV
ncbi:MAG TPA: MBL fold metallo-hydrolase, partial [Acidimicrobiales bacterium]|nr:MBL fold metallo-hydrolase [Acidimicrobiales bacterium]